MPTARSLIAGLAFAMTAISCSNNKSPTAPADNSAELAPARRPGNTGPIVQQVTNLLVTNPATGQTALFTGALTITSFATNAAGDLLANGTLVGDVTGAITTGGAPPHLSTRPSPTFSSMRGVVRSSTWISDASSSTSWAWNSTWRRSALT